MNENDDLVKLKKELYTYIDLRINDELIKKNDDLEWYKLKSFILGIKDQYCLTYNQLLVRTNIPSYPATYNALSLNGKPPSNKPGTKGRKIRDAIKDFMERYEESESILLEAVGINIDKLKEAIAAMPKLYVEYYVNGVEINEEGDKIVIGVLDEEYIDKVKKFFSSSVSADEYNLLEFIVLPEWNLSTPFCSELTS